MTSWSPLVILGAPRSGTNLLRDLLTEEPTLGTWPCDEINFIWRHGNLRHPDDRFTPEMARPDVAEFIRNRFAGIARSREANVVVEKTCANTLRVSFVDAILPEARYVVIVRDGIDAAASAIKRWTGSAGIAYIARKARFVPPSDLPYYGARFASNRLRRLLRADRRLSFWGPALPDMANLVAARPLDEVCALQWQQCVEIADAELADIRDDRIHRIRYEELVTSPTEVLTRLAGFVGIPAAALTGSPVADAIDPTLAGKGRRQLDPETIDRLQRLVAPTLDRLGYAGR